MPIQVSAKKARDLLKLKDRNEIRMLLRMQISASGTFRLHMKFNILFKVQEL